MTLKERFLHYVSFDTKSSEEADACPSTENQWALARTLEQELHALGAANVRVDANCYVMAELPANTSANVPVLGLIAHLDTSPDASGTNVRPQIIENYQGQVIVLNREKNLVLDPKEFTSLKAQIGHTLITTDGTTLLGADDKAGVAEIMSVLDFLQTHPEIPHGKICIGFTPDEEIGNGAELFDVKAFGADFAYTVDGGELGELEYENFNGANCGVFVQGKSIHPGSAKNKMVNAALIANEFASMLPACEAPEHTEGYEGFYHLHQMHGDVTNAEIQYIIRDHDREKFEARKAFVHICGEFLNKKYGEGTVQVVTQDRYFNMKEQILPHMELIGLAEKAMKMVDITPKIAPIRGGTDGARLSYMGLPCPNLCTGGYNYHGPFEYCSLTEMEKVVEMLVKLVELFALEMAK